MNCGNNISPIERTHNGCSAHILFAYLKAGYMQPIMDEARVNSSIFSACSALRKGVISTLGWIHLRTVEAVWVPAVPRAIPNIEPTKATVVVQVNIRLKKMCFLVPRALSMASS